jgi:hypothetical protein
MTTVTLTHNAAQARAIEAFKAFMQTQTSKVPAYGDTVTFEIQTTAFGQTWVTAKTDMVGLGEGNLLRAVAAQYWLARIGKRGAVTIKMAPKSFDQFQGKRAFGYLFDHKS